MPTTFTCPSCAASLSVETDKIEIQCPFCGTRVIVPQEISDRVQRSAAPVIPSVIQPASQSIPLSAEPPSGPAPYAPGGIIVSSTLFSPITGGILAAENWRRLGKPRYAIVAVVVGLIGLIVALGANTWFTLHPAGNSASLAALIAVDVVFGLILAATQQSAYREWVATANNGVNPSIRRSGCLPFLAILAVSVVIAIVLASVLQPAITGVLASLEKPQTFTDGGVSFTIPSGWVDASSQISQQDLCTQANQQCIALSYHSTDDATANFVRFNGAAFLALAPKDIDASVWATVLKQYPAAKEISTQALKVDGRDAYQRIYSYDDAGTNHTRLLEFVKEDSGAVVRLDITGSTAEFSADRSDIDAMANSIHFTASKTT